ncbi:HEAT repeat domain-containing protein [Bryobacter aggregatus]|uniref:HEAT repeat domain-containing protein n=1 Tax=Bryobacter aggregatus TaxID=360054 RepID=UPI0004E155B7|nr:HEAT repeat domain-containing protein [Bryobacter aggregatus]
MNWLRWIQAGAIATTILVSGQQADLDMHFEREDLTFSLHEPILASLRVSNRSSQSLKVDFGAGYREAFRLSVIEPDGQRRALPPYPIQEGMTEVGQEEIASGKSYTRMMILNEWLGFTTPGIYQLSVALPEIRASAEIRITILARDARRLNKVCAELAQAALKTDDFGEALLLTRALGFAVDPEAVPYLQKVASKNDGLTPLAVEGLIRIGNRNAVDALQDLAGHPSASIATIARGGLGMIRHNTKDASLKKVIDRFLANEVRL